MSGLDNVNLTLEWIWSILEKTYIMNNEL